MGSFAAFEEVQAAKRRAFDEHRVFRPAMGDREKRVAELTDHFVHERGVKNRLIARAWAEAEVGE